MITLCTPKVVIKIFDFSYLPSIRMINLSLNELKLIAKSRNIKDYKKNLKMI